MVELGHIMLSGGECVGVECVCGCGSVCVGVWGGGGGMRVVGVCEWQMLSNVCCEDAHRLVKRVLYW